MAEMKRAAGYVKLAKLWERSKASAMVYHRHYFQEVFADTPDFALQDVYIDITGYKETYKRIEMLRLMRDCTLGKVDCIVPQTMRSYAFCCTSFLNCLFGLILSPTMMIFTG